MLKLNGVAVASPKPYKVETLDIDSEGSVRNARGNMLRDRITIKRKIGVSWGPLSQNEISTILTAVGAVFFPVEYLDPQFGLVTKTMQVGNRSAAICVVEDGIPTWEGLEFNLIEQ